MRPLLRAEHVQRVYAGRVVLALDELDAHGGEILGLAGHNGSGKSTLLRLFALLETPDAGRILFENAATSIHDLAQRQQITLLLQTPYLLSRSVESNIAYGLKVRGIHDPQRVRQALELVGLEPDLFLRRRRHELSGGEAQRVALAARLALRPRVLLMDEPTASVDEDSAVLIARVARICANEGAAVVIVSHDREWLDPLADRVVRLKGGRVVSLF